MTMTRALSPSAPPLAPPPAPPPPPPCSPPPSSRPPRLAWPCSPSAGTSQHRDAPTPTVPLGADARWLPTALATVGAPTAALPLLAAHGAWQGRAVVVNSFGGAAGAVALLLAATAARGRRAQRAAC